MKLFTIGFTKKSAEAFFGELHRAGVKSLIDVRLNNVSQLAGFTKRDDLRYFTKTICHIDYIHLPELAPTQDILDAYRKDKDWGTYEHHFLDLMAKRKVEEKFQREMLEDGCLLCSEENPSKCHRRLVAEYLKRKWGDVEIQHLA